MLTRADYRNIPGVIFADLAANAPIESVLGALDEDRILHFRDPQGNTYLHWAIGAGMGLAILKGLIDCGPDLNAVNAEGETALFRAVWYGKEALVKILLERGADPNVVTNGALSPLTVALENGHAAVVKMLLAHGAKPCRKEAAA